MVTFSPLTKWLFCALHCHALADVPSFSRKIASVWVSATAYCLEVIERLIGGEKSVQTGAVRRRGIDPRSLMGGCGMALY